VKLVTLKTTEQEKSLSQSRRQIDIRNAIEQEIAEDR
jgi:hypothetical protein